MEHIGEAIRHHRERRDMSRSELARRAHINPGSVGRLESGEVKNPRIGTVIDLAAALEVDPQELLRFVMGASTVTERVEASGPFTAVYQRDGEWWVGYVEELPGANAQERTLEEARESLREAVSDVLAANRELTRTEFEDRDVVREPIGA